MSRLRFVRASGEAIRGTLKYCSMHFTIIFLGRLRRGNPRYTKILDLCLSNNFIKALYTITLSNHFTQALYQSTLQNHFIQALYQSTSHKHFIQALYQSTLSKHFIKVFLKHFRNTYQTSLYYLLTGVRYYEV